ncbi:MAG: thiamine pyrophosphate-binding protein [Flavobacteriia bacterium]|nr:thiamine pyrophosphate-binding protein [Flavobacteriia bacterium]
MCQFFRLKRIYGIGGDFAVNLIKAFEKNFDLLPASNEMHASFSACAQAEIESLGCCLTTYTVGSLPCISAAALAKSEKLPVIFVSGAPGENEIGNTAIHHTVTSASSWNIDYDASLNSFRGLGIRAERLQGQRNLGQPDLAGEQFFELILHAYTYNEPVFIEIPRDLIFMKTQSLKLPEKIEDIVINRISYNSTDVLVEEISYRLKNCKKPVLYFGGALKLNVKLKKIVLQFCEKNAIPFISSWFGKGILDDFHSLSLGAYNGVFTEQKSRKYFENEVDYILEIATSIYKMDANSAFGTGTHILEGFENKTVLNGTSKLQVDLIAIFEKLIEVNFEMFDFIPEINIEDELSLDTRIDFHNLTRVLNEIQTKSSKPFIYLPEVGNSYFASYSLKIKNTSIARGWLCNAWYGAMGTSMPYARAVCEVLKEKQADDVAIVITGDGGFHFQLNELIHFMKNNLNVVILYMRNNIFHLGKNSESKIYSCSSPEFDIQKLIESYGGIVYKCSLKKDFQFCLTETINLNKGITLIEIPVDPKEEFQCREIQLLNTYIGAKNGVEKAVAAWNNIINE